MKILRKERREMKRRRMEQIHPRLKARRNGNIISLPLTKLLPPFIAPPKKMVTLLISLFITTKAISLNK
jgi:hypothetical protein